MQCFRFYYLKTLSVVVVLCFFTSLSSAGTSLEADPLKSSSAKNTLQKGPGKTSENHEGKDFSYKNKSATSKKQAVKNKTITGFCCIKGVVKKSTRIQCQKRKGMYYETVALARKGCRPEEITCCVAGTLSSVSSVRCRQLKGTEYSSVAEAKRKCRPSDIFCCTKGKISTISSQECQRQHGAPYKSMGEAKKNCKPKDVFCCVKGKVSKTSSKLCRKQRGIPYKSLAAAKKKCFAKNIFCCADGKVSKISPKQCAEKAGAEFASRADANRRCAQVSKVVYGLDKARKVGPMARSSKRNTGSITDFRPRKKTSGRASYGLERQEPLKEKQSCNFSGLLLIDKHEPSERGITLKLWSNEKTGSPHISRRIRLSKGGNFTFSVPSSATSYSLAPSFLPGSNYRETLHNGYLSGVAELMCWENDPRDDNNIILRWSSLREAGSVSDLAENLKEKNNGDHYPGTGEFVPTVKYGCNFSGRVLLDGQVPSEEVYLEVTPYRKDKGKAGLVKLRPLPADGTFSVFVPAVSGTYSFEPVFDSGNRYREDFHNGSLAGTAELLCLENDPQDERDIVLRWSSSHLSVPQNLEHRFNSKPDSSL